jgi:hypothetical protein
MAHTAIEATFVDECHLNHRYGGRDDIRAAAPAEPRLLPDAVEAIWMYLERGEPLYLAQPQPRSGVARSDHS